MSKDIKIGVSIYSFTYFYDLKLMSLEDLLRTAHERWGMKELRSL